MSDFKESLTYAFRPKTVWIALRVSAVIGSLLAVINHYDEWLRGDTTNISLLQIGFTYLVPYLVSIHGQVYGIRNR